jgi:hypothetical protein
MPIFRCLPLDHPQEGIQSTIGRLILPSPASPYVGTVTYYDGRGGLEGQEKIKLRCQEVRNRGFNFMIDQQGV